MSDYFTRDDMLNRINAAMNILDFESIQGLQVYNPPKIDDFEATDRVTIQGWYKKRMIGSAVRFFDGQFGMKEQNALVRDVIWVALVQEMFARKQIFRVNNLVLKHGDHSLAKLVWKEFWWNVRFKIKEFFDQ